MKWNERRVGLLVVMALAFATFIGASAPQQPLVVRNATAQGAVPTDCDKNLSDVPRTPRLDVARIPMPNISTVALAPPSRELRAELEDIHRALTRNDRPAFDEHLAAARQIVAGYPSGAEKRSAEELVRVYTDTAHLWDAQFASPFFDESSAEYDILKDYPGYAEAVRRGMLTDDRDHRFYPAAESRAFLTRVAAERLARIGISSPRASTTRVARAEEAVPKPARVPKARSTSAESRTTAKTPPATSTKRRAPSSKTASASSRTTSTPAKTTPSHTTTPHRKTARSTPPQTSERTPVSSTPVTHTPTRVASETRPPIQSPATTQKPTPAPVPIPVATTTQPATAPPPSPTTSVSTPTSVATTTTRTDTNVAPPSDATTMAPTETAIATTSSVPKPAPVTAPAPRRSMILPVILILVGLGVLILLFRAST